MPSGSSGNYGSFSYDYMPCPNAPVVEAPGPRADAVNRSIVALEGRVAMAETTLDAIGRSDGMVVSALVLSAVLGVGAVILSVCVCVSANAKVAALQAESKEHRKILKVSV